MFVIFIDTRVSMSQWYPENSARMKVVQRDSVAISADSRVRLKTCLITKGTN